MKQFFSKLFSILTRHDKKFLFILVFISIAVSLIEMVGVGAILPFINIASNFTHIHTNTYTEKIYTFFHFDSDVNFVIAIGITLLIFLQIAGIISITFFEKNKIKKIKQLMRKETN